MKLSSLMLGASIIAMSGIAFAAKDKGGSGSAPPPPPAGEQPPAPPAGDNAEAAAPEFVIASAATVPMPTPKRSGARARQTTYPFDKLTIAEGAQFGDSFGIKDPKKTAKKMASTVNAAGHRYDVAVKDANGNPVLNEGAEIKDANGNVTGRAPGKPKMQMTRKFAVYDVDPAKDPIGANVRVWRVAVGAPSTPAA